MALKLVERETFTFVDFVQHFRAHNIRLLVQRLNDESNETQQNMCLNGLTVHTVVSRLLCIWDMFVLKCRMCLKNGTNTSPFNG